MLLFGFIKMIGYFSKDLYRLAFQFDLASGILLMALPISISCHTGDGALGVGMMKEII